MFKHFDYVCMYQYRDVQYLHLLSFIFHYLNWSGDPYNTSTCILNQLHVGLRVRLRQCLKLNLIAKTENNVAFVHELVINTSFGTVQNVWVEEGMKIYPALYNNDIWTISQQGYSIHVESTVPSSHCIWLEVESNWRISRHLSFAGRKGKTMNH